LLEDQELNIEDLTDVYTLSRSAGGDLIATPISVGKAFTFERLINHIIPHTLQETSYWQYKEVRRELSACIRGLGMKLTRAIAFAV
jgi:arginine-tRNA-protein transferase